MVGQTTTTADTRRYVVLVQNWHQELLERVPVAVTMPLYPGTTLGSYSVTGECPTGSRKSAATVNTSYPTFCISAMLSSSRSRCAFSIQRCS